MKTVHAKRLLKLADFLDALPRKRFDYSCWVGDDWKGKPDLSCGTTACALGWATAMPTFRRLGLRMVGDMPGLSFDKAADLGATSEAIFGLDWSGHLHLFDPIRSGLGWDATPKQAHKAVGEVWTVVRVRPKAARSGGSAGGR